MVACLDETGASDPLHCSENPPLSISLLQEMSRLKTVGWRVTSCNHDFSLSMRFDSLSHGTTIQAHHMHITCTSHAHHMHITCTSHAHHMHITRTSHAHHMHITHTSHTHHTHITRTSHAHHMHITRTSHAHHITSVSIWHGMSSLNCPYVDLRPPSSPSMPPFLVVPATITDTSLYYIRALHNQQRLPVWDCHSNMQHTHTRTHTRTHARMHARTHTHTHAHARTVLSASPTGVVLVTPGDWCGLATQFRTSKR